MANELESTEFAALTPEVWSPRYLRAMYSVPVASQRVLNLADDVKGPGDKIHVPTEPRLTVGSVFADGTAANQSVTPSDTEVLIDKIKHCSVEVVKYAQRQARQSLMDAFPSSAGKALMEQIDVDILALQSELTTNSVGSSDAYLGEDELAAAVQKLLAQRLNPLAFPDEFTFVFADNQYASLSKLRLIADAAYRGESGSAVNAWTKKVLGIPAYITAEVASSSGRQNLLFHRECFAWAAQKMPGIEKASGIGAGKITDRYTSWNLYGVKTVREAFGVKMTAKA